MTQSRDAMTSDAMNWADGYPKRPKFFIVKFIRLLVSSGGMQELSAEAVKLLLAIVAAEDEFHYSRPARFWNSQLYEKLGISSERSAGQEKTWTGLHQEG